MTNGLKELGVAWTLAFFLRYRVSGRRMEVENGERTK